MGFWQQFQDWFLKLGEQYNVNPFIFGGIYIGAIPFFFASLYWTVNNIKKKKSPIIPILLMSFFFISSYLYLLIAGHNIPIWVYAFIGLMIGYGVYSTFRKIRTQLKK